jgi:hypothetical protein
MSGARKAMGLSRAAGAGQEAFTTSGTFSWVCPVGVTSVCVVAVGPGGFGNTSGKGGGLGWANNISVVPGETYTVVVGAPGSTTDSYFISSSTVCGRAGQNGGTYVGQGGGNGGVSSSGVGGAGGYSGNGGNGSSDAGLPGGNGAGGGGGGGATNFFNDTVYIAGGGGVGILGQGANGTGAPGPAAGQQPVGGGGGSGGTAGGGAFAPGGQYGGAGGLWSSGENFARQTPGGGAVRIIWGADRAFPSTNTGNV